MPLTDIQIRNLKPRDKPYKISDGGRMHLHVTPKGSKLWRLAYLFDGKEKTLSFGRYPDVTLAQARERRAEAKALIAQGIDPSAKRKTDKAEQLAETEHTFMKIAEELIEKHTKERKSEATLIKKRWYMSMVADDFGNRPISEITAADILVPLRRVEAKGTYETARRLRSNIGQVFRYAIATARADNDPTFGLRDALITPKVTHRAAATTKKDFGRILKAVWTYDGGSPTTRAALKLMALLYPRPGELRLALWDEFDLEKRVWTIPASRMKMRREHAKPLSGEVISLLEDLRPFTGHGERVFPALTSRDRPMSENTMNQALRRMGFEKDEMTSHGFRASASSLLNESGLWNEDAIEAELAHVDSDQVRRAYHRAQYWGERVKMAEWWAGKIKGMINTKGSDGE